MSIRRKGAFRFLDLPPEIRNWIYSLTLCFDGAVHPSTGPPSSKSTREKPDYHYETESALRLLEVNRLIHFEAREVFYFYNTFDIRLIWLASLFDCVGGGRLVFNTITQVLIAEATAPSALWVLYFIV